MAERGHFSKMTVRHVLRFDFLIRPLYVPRSNDKVLLGILSRMLFTKLLVAVTAFAAPAPWLVDKHGLCQNPLRVSR